MVPRGLTYSVYVGGLSLQCWGSTDNGFEQFVTCGGGPSGSGTVQITRSPVEEGGIGATFANCLTAPDG